MSRRPRSTSARFVARPLVVTPWPPTPPSTFPAARNGPRLGTTRELSCAAGCLALSHSLDAAVTIGVRPTLHESSTAAYSIGDYKRLPPLQHQQHATQPIPPHHIRFFGNQASEPAPISAIPSTMSMRPPCLEDESWHLKAEGARQENEAKARENQVGAIGLFRGSGVSLPCHRSFSAGLRPSVHCMSAALRHPCLRLLPQPGDTAGTPPSGLRTHKVP
jgi:hypothetical protein